jgi:8-oxo-dGTP diphosphatase
MSERFIRYVCGFLFSEDRQRVLLIRKNRPTFHAGLFNGVGGKVEILEAPREAMEREFGEEADVEGLDWQPVSVLRGDSWTVHFFAAFSDMIHNARTLTEEPVQIFPVRDLQDIALVKNAQVMITLALDQSGIIKPVVMHDSIPQAA